MKIKVFKKGAFSTSGNSILRMIQNNSTPLLDLITRESIQNSLDAQLPDANEVKVKILVKNFSVSKLAEEYDTVGQYFKNICRENEAKFLAISDKNTFGLTGSIYENDCDKPNGGNLVNLVYNIMNGQQNEGSGGSWGMGKTLYYRAGIGIVMFYSRIKLDSGKYQNRLISVLIEDEKKPDTLLKLANFHTGIAFFGEIDQNGMSYAITDDEHISKILNIFNLSKYEDDETGTMIIIPFIDEEKLLSSNKEEGSNDAWWQKTVVDYFKIAAMRWYFPRISDSYKNGARLSLEIEDENSNICDIKDCFENALIFKKFSELYSFALLDTKYSDDNCWIKKVPIERKTNMKNPILGYFAYGKVTKNEINKFVTPGPNPFKCAGIDVDNNEINKKPLVCYCRKFGMIVNYERDLKLTSEIVLNEGEFIIGIFVLNFDNEVMYKSKTINLDEYIRNCEKGDHMNWDDCAIFDNEPKLRIIKNIKDDIGKTISNEYGVSEATKNRDSCLEFSLAKDFGLMLLPNTGFGEKGSNKTKNSVPKIKGSRNGTGIVKKVDSNVISFSGTTFEADKIKLTYNVSINSYNNDIIMFNNTISTIGGNIDANSREENGFSFPHNIDSILIKTIKIEGKGSSSNPIIFNSEVNSADFENYNISFLKTQSGKCYGVTFKNENDSIQIDFDITIVVSTIDRLCATNMEFVLKERE